MTPGTRLGSYEVISAIGAGGMGEVYRARDMKLNRDVALKILPHAFALDPDRLARFTREAHLLASLNHPNIAAIYGLEDSDGVRALVLELVEGPTLADRIAHGAIPADEALAIARQVAMALEAAQEQGIVHRDLKPANIKLRPDGTVKVLDFGLAKLAGPPEGGPYARDVGAGFSRPDTISPTITSPAMTRMGVILGTAAYMSPEQAKGREADKRSDVWAFGCVLYEMLAGRRAFEGEDVSDTLANVLKTSPDWNALPATTPAAIRRLLRRSLEKDRTRRLHDIADARLEIDEADANQTGDLAAREANASARPVGRAARALPWAMAAAFGVLAIALWAPWRTSAPTVPVRVEATLGADVSLTGIEFGSAIALSPDGRTLAFSAQSGASTPPQLYVRRLDQLRATALAGTDGAFGPFFSPDAQWIAFFANGKLKKVAAAGGAVITLCDAPAGRGGSWAEDGTITFRPLNTDSDGGLLMRVSSAGGTPEPLTTAAQGELSHRFPQVLPEGTAVLYTTNNGINDYENATILVQPLPSGARKVLVRRGYYPRYVPSGHLLFIREGTLFAAPFDADRLELTGEPAPVLEDVLSVAATGVAQFAVSATGTFTYVPGQTVGFTTAPIVWMDRTGKTSALRAQPSNWSNPAFAPDGQRLAVDINDGKQFDVWVYEWARGTMSCLTFDPVGAGFPLWTPDGQRIVFSSRRGDKTTMNLYWQRADGAGDVQRLTESTNNQVPGSWHPSGRFLAFVEAPRGQGNIMILPMEGDARSGWKPGQPAVFLNTPVTENQPAFSPDGRWLAYTSIESGRNEVYVRPFPGPGGKWQISTDGGANPMWSRTRPEIFYTRDQRIMVATYAGDGDSFRAGRPQLVSETMFVPRRPATTLRNLDVHPDGQRFAVAQGLDPSAVKRDKVVFIFNFFDELRRVAPGR